MPKRQHQLFCAVYGVGGTGQYADGAKAFTVIHVLVVLKCRDALIKDLGESLFIEHLCTDALCQHAFQTKAALDTENVWMNGEAGSEERENYRIGTLEAKQSAIAGLRSIRYHRPKSS